MYLYQGRLQGDGDLSGAVYVVDDLPSVHGGVQIQDQFKCADINGNGYYSCTSPIYGKYLIYQKVRVEGIDDRTVLTTLLAYGSTNLAITSIMLEELNFHPDTLDTHWA